MSGFIRDAPIFDISSCELFRSAKKLFADCSGFFDFCITARAFWRRGSVGLVARICFAEALLG